MLIQTPAVVGDDVALEGRQVLRWTHPHPQEGEPAADGLHDTEVRQGVAELDRVVVVLAAVEDAAHPGTQQEVLVGQDLVPELLHGDDLGEEPVAADVEPPAVTFDRPTDAAEDGVLLEHDDGVPRLGQPVGGGQPGRSPADDDHWAARPIRLSGVGCGFRGVRRCHAVRSVSAGCVGRRRAVPVVAVVAGALPPGATGGPADDPPPTGPRPGGGGGAPAAPCGAQDSSSPGAPVGTAARWTVPSAGHDAARGGHGEPTAGATDGTGTVTWTGRRAVAPVAAPDRTPGCAAGPDGCRLGCRRGASRPGCGPPPRARSDQGRQPWTAHGAGTTVRPRCSPPVAESVPAGPPSVGRGAEVPASGTRSPTGGRYEAQGESE